MCVQCSANWCSVGAEVVQCRCVCSVVLKWCSVGAEMVQCRCVCRAVQVCVQCSTVLKWCSAVQVGYMGHMGLCVISVKKC